MNMNQLNQLLNELKERFENELYDFEAVGIRFEDKERTEGDVITESSKHNVDREDDREFPEYGTAEYDEMEDLDGVSAWKIDEFEFDGDQREYLPEHCYLIASNDCTFDDGFLMLDEGEVIMDKAVVLAKIF